MVGDGIVVGANNCGIVLEHKCISSGNVVWCGHWSTHLLFNDVLLQTLGWNCEETLLSYCEDLTCQESIVSWLAQLIDVFGEDVGNEEHVGWVGVGSGDGVGIDAVEGCIDLKSGTS